MAGELLIDNTAADTLAARTPSYSVCVCGTHTHTHTQYTHYANKAGHAAILAMEAVEAVHARESLPASVEVAAPRLLIR